MCCASSSALGKPLRPAPASRVWLVYGGALLVLVDAVRESCTASAGLIGPPSARRSEPRLDGALRGDIGIEESSSSRSAESGRLSAARRGRRVVSDAEMLVLGGNAGAARRGGAACETAQQREPTRCRRWLPL
jgi:hypothetical protein